MISKTRLFTPGPTPLFPGSQFAMAAADIHHRTAEFRALFSKVLKQLQAFIGTSNDVVILTASGTGAMEAAVSNLCQSGRHGSGDQRRQIRRALGEPWRRPTAARCARFRLLTGRRFRSKRCARSFLAEVRAVFVQATETSTGMRHCIPALAEMVRGTDALLVVDAITGLGTTHLEADAVDVIIGGSQKALMIPPGLAYPGRQRARLEAYGHHQPAALLLRSAQGTQVERQGRSLVHAFGGADRGHGRLARLLCHARRRRCRRRAASAGRQRRTLRRHDSRGSPGARAQTVRAGCAERRRNRRACARGHRQQRYRQTIQGRLRRNSLRRTRRRDEGKNLPRLPSRISRLRRHHGHCRRAGAGVGTHASGQVSVGRGPDGRATG